MGLTGAPLKMPPAAKLGCCSDKEDKQCVECRCCKEWFHQKCLSMSDDVFAWMSVKGHLFFCPNCSTKQNKTLLRDSGATPDSPTVSQTPPRMSEILSALTKMERCIDTLKNSVDLLVQENRRMSAENHALSDRILQLEQRDPSALNFDVIYTAIDEHFQWKDKRNNFVVHFLPDNSETAADENGDGAPQLPSTDLEKIQKLVSDTGGDVSSIVQVFRMGSIRDDGKPRSLKVQCSSTWTK